MSGDNGRRLDKVAGLLLGESNASPREAEEDRRWGEACDRLAATMAPQHIALLGETPAEGTPAARLASECYWRIIAETTPIPRWPAGPLALPREVAQVYLDDADARTLHACASCGYRVPVRCTAPVFGPWGPQSGPRCPECERRHTADGCPPCEFRAYFPACPLCGGKTGRGAYQKAHIGKSYRPGEGA